jgi:hypothetical protein
MLRAGHAHTDCPGDDIVAEPAIESAFVDGMLVVEAAAKVVPLDQLVTHRANGLSGSKYYRDATNATKEMLGQN